MNVWAPDIANSFGLETVANMKRTKAKRIDQQLAKERARKLKREKAKRGN